MLKYRGPCSCINTGPCLGGVVGAGGVVGGAVGVVVGGVWVAVVGLLLGTG